MKLTSYMYRSALREVSARDLAVRNTCRLASVIAAQLVEILAADLSNDGVAEAIWHLSVWPSTLLRTRLEIAGHAYLQDIGALAGFYRVRIAA
jgi:hypothetical protein